VLITGSSIALALGHLADGKKNALWTANKNATSSLLELLDFSSSLDMAKCGS
jgi:hypothetical protein